MVRISIAASGGRLAQNHAGENLLFDPKGRGLRLDPTGFLLHRWRAGAPASAPRPHVCQTRTRIAGSCRTSGAPPIPPMALIIGRVPSVFLHPSGGARPSLPTWNSNRSTTAAIPIWPSQGCLAAGLDGIRHQLDPGEPVDLDPGNFSDAERAQRGIQRLPHKPGCCLRCAPGRYGAHRRPRPTTDLGLSGREAPGEPLLRRQITGRGGTPAFREVLMLWHTHLRFEPGLCPRGCR